jgi:hypothetical protein
VEFLGPGGQDSVGCPKAMATVIANATARRTANAITCLVSGTGSMGIRHQVLGG